MAVLTGSGTTSGDTLLALIMDTGEALEATQGDIPAGEQVVTGDMLVAMELLPGDDVIMLQ